MATPSEIKAASIVSAFTRHLDAEAAARLRWLIARAIEEAIRAGEEAAQLSARRDGRK